MLPIGPLMVEHRLIERMVRLLNEELANIRKNNRPNIVFLNTAVDFFRTYADRLHHGKEEDILFKGLSKKKLSLEHKRIVNELFLEHVYGRENVKRLAVAKEKYATGNLNVLNDILTSLENLRHLYPAHIEKEDKHFFLPSMKYFTKKEQDDMLGKFWEFDKKLIHEKYKAVVEQWEGK